jgi:serine/threonine-protein kinase HipA
MQKLTLQIHDNILGWLDAGELIFHSKFEVMIEYDLDYSSGRFGQGGSYGFSLLFPVDVAPYRGPLPGFLIDLIPQGNVLKRLRSRYSIAYDDDYEAILAHVPLASPGNLRIKEPWAAIESQRPHYRHQGFSKSEIINTKENFIEYMEQHGSPIGGTSGAAGGAPKFLLREDFQGRFHADGLLDDSKTKQSYMIKFPFTDSSNSRLLAKTEKVYYDFLKQLPLRTSMAFEIHDDILFIPRFDRVREADGRLHYHGLESLYSAHGINTHGQRLSHEDNLLFIKQNTQDWQTEALEYVCRDILNEALSNTDNHGRNTSFIKIGDLVQLSPIYDVTAMKFFKGDFIMPLTTWQKAPENWVDRVRWLTDFLALSPNMLRDKICHLRDQYLVDMESRLIQCGLPQEMLSLSQDDRNRVLKQLASIK